MAVLNIDRSLKKMLNNSSSNSFTDMGKGANYFSSGGLTKPFPGFSNRDKFPEIHHNAKKVVVDGKPVYYAGGKANAPSPRIVQKVYSKIPDDKKVPVIFQTKKQYLQEYIKNQEIAHNTKFSQSEKQRYIKNELKEMQPVVSRFTTYHNDYMPPRTVFFTDNKFHKDNTRFEMSALHEYWHEKTEGIKHLQDNEIKAEEYAKNMMQSDVQGRDRFDIRTSVWINQLPKNKRETAQTLYEERGWKRKEIAKILNVSSKRNYYYNKPPKRTKYEQEQYERELYFRNKQTDMFYDNSGYPVPENAEQKRIVAEGIVKPLHIVNKMNVEESDRYNKRLDRYYGNNINDFENVDYKDIQLNKEIEILDNVEDNDVSKNRLNKIMMDRVRQITIGYTNVPSKTPLPYHYLPSGEGVFYTSNLTEKARNPYEHTVKNNALNIIKRYPNILTEAENVPGTLAFYQGPKLAKARGVHWSENREASVKALSLVDIRNSYNTRKKYQYNLGRRVFHELAHAKQEADNPINYKENLIQSEKDNIPWKERTAEINAEERAYQKLSEVDKGRGGLASYATPEESFKVMNNMYDLKEREKLFDTLDERRNEYLKQVEANKTAGLEMLDNSIDRSLPIKEDWSNQQLRKNRGYVDLIQVNAQKFKEEFEKDQQTKLAWNKNRSESIANVEVFDAHPQINFNSLLDVNDGRHRINRAAEQGDDIVVAVKGPHIVEKLLSRGIVSEDQSDVNEIDFNDESYDRTYTTNDLLPTVERGIKVESTGKTTFYQPQINRVDIVQKPMYLSGKFQDLFKHGEHIQIVNPLRNEVVRDVKRVNDVARIDPMTGNPEDIIDVPLSTDILYEPWMMDRGSLVFHAPPNLPPGLQNQKLKIATEMDEVRIIEDNNEHKDRNIIPRKFVTNLKSIKYIGDQK